MKNSHEILIPTKYIRVLKLFSAKNDIRYYLNGIMVEFGGGKDTVIAATDGHRVGAFRLDPVDCAERMQFIIPIEVLKETNLSKTLTETPFTFFVEDGIRKIKMLIKSDTWLVCKSVDGIYPDFYRLAIDKVSGEHSEIQAAYLMDLSKASQILHLSKFKFSVANNGREACPIDLCDENFTGILMPMRDDALPEKPKANADWFCALKELRNA